MKKAVIFIMILLSLACSLTSKATPSPKPDPTTPPEPTATQMPSPTPTPTPVPMTDSDFTGIAQDTCLTLEQDLRGVTNSGETFLNRYDLAAAAYQVAADNLSNITADESSAPDAAAFLKYLQNLSGIYSKYGQALNDSYEQSGLTYEEISYYAVIEEGKDFMVFANGEWQALEVADDIKLDFYETKDGFELIAKQLDLSSCVSVDPIFD